MFKKIIKNKNILSFVLAIGVFLLVLLISNYNLLYFLDKKIQNTFYTIHNNVLWNKISDKIVVVEIDNKTLQDWNKYKKKEDRLWRFPFDRKSYIKVINNLKEAWASIIAFDIMFAEQSNKESDNALSWAINKAWNVILWWYIENKWNNEDNNTKIFHKSFFKSIYTWFYNPVIDEYNHVVYSILPFINIKNWIYDNFSISILKRYYSLIYNKDFNSLPQKIDDNFYYLTPYKKIHLAWNWKNEILINYIKNDKYKPISFIDIYDKDKFETIKKYNDFKWKIVIIWASASWIKDVYFTPNGEEPGVYTHVNMINTVLTNNFLQYFNRNLELILIFILIIFSVYFNLNRSSYVLIASNIFIVITFLILFPLFLIKYTYLILNFPAELIVSVIFSLSISNIFKYLIENKNKTKLNKALSEYVSEDVASEILSGEGKVNLDWENKNVAIFFSDIEWFTSISEQFSPEDLVWFLREYLSNMSDIIMDEKWFINKYEWDAIMALWWVFTDDPNKSSNICLAALKQQETLNELNKEWTKRWFWRIKARIGMHMWNAITWNIWSEWRKMEFTALWDSVNLASRLEWVNKFYWTYICASEDIYEAEKENFEFRYLDKIKVKWKEVPVKIYELLGIKWNISKEVLELKTMFESAVNLYLNRDFKWAKEIFTKLIKNWDNAWKMYLDMCDIYIKTPPADDWNGIATMTWK